MISKYLNSNILYICSFDVILEYYILFMLNDTKRKEKIKLMINIVDNNKKLKKYFLLPLINYYMIEYVPFKFVGEYLPEQALFKYGETFDSYKKWNSTTKTLSQCNEMSIKEINDFCKKYQDHIKYITQTQELLMTYKTDELFKKIDDFLKQEENNR